METNYTKGEWTVAYSTTHPRIEIDSRENGMYSKIALIPLPATRLGKSTDEKATREAEANAKLIAAAPELLEALQNAITEMSPVWNFDLRNAPEYVQKMISAVEKATGK